MAPELHKILLVYKPKGVTSYDVIRMLQKRLGKLKMGHGGTLDPMAEGLLVIGIGKATKELKHILGKEKEYVADIKLGIQTTTDDIEGDIVVKKDFSHVQEEDIKKIVEDLPGTLELEVPIYSAIKKKGRPLYDYARKGQIVDIPVKNMTIYEAEFLSYERGIIKIKFKVSSGTYIRSIAREIGKRLGTVATLCALVRTTIGEYSIREAIDINQV